MLSHTFCHMPGVGARTEQDLWQRGLLSWRDLSQRGEKELSPAKARKLTGLAAESTRHLEQRNAQYFDDGLPASQSWRMFGEFSDSVAYLDIETTGLSGDYDQVTTMALYDGKTIYHYVAGKNIGDFHRQISQYKLIVTYNGKTFDIPFLRKNLRARIDHAHIDLRYVLARLGHAGGLKVCEKAFGLDRDELDGVDGFFAVLLWHDFKRNGNARALETLLAYNITDVVNLSVLMPLAYNLSLRGTPFEKSKRLPVPKLPEIPFQADSATVDRIKRLHFR